MHKLKRFGFLGSETFFCFWIYVTDRNKKLALLL